MKISTRIKLAVLSALFVAMFIAGSASASLNYVVTAELDESGTVMLYNHSYVKDGEPFEYYGSYLTSAARNTMGNDLLIRIRFRKAGTMDEWTTVISKSPVIFEKTYEEAVFVLDSPLEPGLYEFDHEWDTIVKTPTGYDDTDEGWEAWADDFISSNFTEAEWDAIEANMAIFDDGYPYPQMNNPVLIEKEQSTSPSSGGGGCNAGFGMFGLLLAGLAIRKHRKI
jgi:hypothetical protein